MTMTFPNSQVIAPLLKEKKHGDKGEVRCKDVLASCESVDEEMFVHHFPQS
jgi:hypothetical protein